MGIGKEAPPLQARCVVDLADLLPQRGEYLCGGVDLQGTVYAVSRTSRELLVVKGGIGIFPKSQFDTSNTYRVVGWRDGQVREMNTPDETIVVSFAQSLGEHLLMVGARCTWRPNAVERNAVVYDWSGKVVDRFTLGDGIQDVRATPDGTLWVSYFDEGIFGNYGWGSPGPEPMGVPGLCSYDPKGIPGFAYDAERAGTDSMCDAYAMNVCGDDDVWVHFYTEFPVVNIRKREYRVWTSPFGGASALAVREPHVLLFGGYDRPSAAHLVRLGPDGTGKLVGVRDVVDEKGVPATKVRPFGIGAKLYLLDGTRCLVLDDEWTQWAREID